VGLEAAEAGDTVDDGLVARGESQGFDSTIELVPAQQLVLEEGEVLGEDGAVILGEGTGLEDLADPVHVTGGPVGALTIDEAAAPVAAWESRSK